LVALTHRVQPTDQPDEDEYRRLNVSGTEAIVAELLNAGVRDHIYMSSIKAIAEESAVPLREDDKPRPQDAYGRTKLEAEAVVRTQVHDAGGWCAILRPPMVYGAFNRGNLPRLTRLVSRQIPLPFGRVRNERSIVYVGNLVDALVTVVRCRPTTGHVFHVADDEAPSTPELVRGLAKHLGVRPRLLPVPPIMLRTAGRVGDVLRLVAPCPVGSDEVRKLIGSLVVDSSKIRKMCGWTPPFDASAGLATTVEWLLQEGALR
jgi:nucleoside-diphosphate-sugar epimerase